MGTLRNHYAISIPTWEDLEDPHMVVYTQLQAEWMGHTLNIFSLVNEWEAEGASTEAIADRIREEWLDAGAKMEKFAKFAEEHRWRLSPGPGLPQSCILCERRPPRTGSDTCRECIVEVLKNRT